MTHNSFIKLPLVSDQIVFASVCSVFNSQWQLHPNGNANKQTNTKCSMNSLSKKVKWRAEECFSFWCRPMWHVKVTPRIANHTLGRSIRGLPVTCLFAFFHALQNFLWTLTITHRHTFQLRCGKWLSVHVIGKQFEPNFTLQHHLYFSPWLCRPLTPERWHTVCSLTIKRLNIWKTFSSLPLASLNALLYRVVHPLHTEFCKMKRATTVVWILAFYYQALPQRERTICALHILGKKITECLLASITLTILTPYYYYF